MRVFTEMADVCKKKKKRGRKRILTDLERKEKRQRLEAV
jgi:hypothetical protein